MNIKRILKTVFITATAIACCIATAIGYGYYIVMLQKVDIIETEFLYITPEDNSTSVVQKLSAITNGSTKGFELLAKHNKFDNRKRSGRFAINDGDNMHTIYRRIVSNEQTPVKLVIPATRTIVV